MPTPTPPAGIDLRRHPRFELLASVEIHLGSETLILPARNLSLGGIFLGSDGNDLSAFDVGSWVEVLLFDAADESREPVRGPAKIVRRRPDGMALAWREDAELSKHLLKLLETISP